MAMLHFGEVFVTIPGAFGGPPTFSERVATPHVWEGTLFYLSAMALSMPERFDPEITALPLPALAMPAAFTPSGGCGTCSAVGDEASRTSWASWGLACACALSLVTARVMRRARGLRRRAR